MEQNYSLLRGRFVSRARMIAKSFLAILFVVFLLRGEKCLGQRQITTEYTYNDQNGLVSTKTIYGADPNTILRWESIWYAYSRDIGMQEAHMLSQVYERDEQMDDAGNYVKERTSWQTINGVYRESAISNYLSSEGMFVTTSTFGYDIYGNITSVTDANGYVTSYLYGYDHSKLIGVISNGGGGASSVDDFNDGSITDGDPISWTTSGMWSISDDGITSANTSYAGNHNSQFQNFTADVSLCVLSNYGNSGNWAGIHFGSTSTDVYNTGYLVYYRYDGQINLYQQGTNLSSVSTGLQPNVWRRLSVSVNGTNVQVFIDGQRFINYTLSALATSGYISLCTSGTDTKYDNFRSYPFGSVARSYEYDPVTFQLTGESDASGFQKFFCYDGLQRLTAIQDYARRTIEQFSYHYSRTGNNDTYNNSDPNYVETLQCRTSTDYSDLKGFFDGLSRKIQDQTQDGNGTIVSASVDYDALGRVEKVHKPYELTSHSSPQYDPSYGNNVVNYWNQYGLSGPYFSETIYCADPLDRVSEQSFPGATWSAGAQHDKRFTYSPSSGNLYKYSARDEQGFFTDTYKDLFDRTVKTVQDVGSSGHLNLMTNYFYDMVDNLTSTTDPSNKTTTYVYNSLKQLTQKTSPDAGTVQYLYDKNGNPRLVKDANHTGTMNAINIPLTTMSSTITNASLPAMTLPGRITLSLTVVSGSGTPSLSVNADGVPVAKVATSSSSTNTFILPKGTYTYSISPNGTTVQYSIVCTNGFEFVYNKYDALNRLTEAGEYQSTATGNFTQANADNTNFPASNVVVNRTFSYDSPSADALAAGQRNLLGRLSTSISYRLGEVALTTFYSYDENGRVEWIVQKELGKKIFYEYDLQGNVTRKFYQDTNNGTNNYYTWYEYDQVGRLANVYSGADLSSRVKEVAYTYNAGGKVSRLQLGTAQGVDYAYNERDWLSSINNQDLSGETQLPSDKFGEVIGYNNIDHIGRFLQPAPQYNGNISWLMYNMRDVPFEGSAGTTTLVGYAYSYDNTNRLLGANFGYYANDTWNPTTRFGENGISYDADGNISALTRYPSGAAVLLPLLTLSSRPGGSTLYYGAVAIVASASYVVPSGSNDTFEASASIRLQPGFRASAGSTFRARISSSPQGSDPGPMDQLAYHYQGGTNRLAYVEDGVASDTYSSDLDNQPTNNYAYDGNGNMVQDLGNRIAFVIYDINSLPVTVYWTNNSQMQYSYDANGNRFRKYDGIVYTYYVNGADGKTEAITCSNLPTTTYNLWGGDNVGKVVRNGTLLTRYYYLKDHLGSVRMTVDAAGSRKSWNDYYPFGLLIDGRNGVDGDNDPRYKFTGKERDAETGLDYFGARYYDSRIGRWLSVDLLAEKYPGLSPYAYAANDPMYYVDPSGDSLEMTGNYSQLALHAIRGGLPEKLRDYVQMVEKDGRYFIDERLLNQAKSESDSPEFLALRQIVNSDALTKFDLIDAIDHFTALNRATGKDVSFSFGSGPLKGAGGITLTTGVINTLYDYPGPNAEYDLISNVRGANQVHINVSMSTQDLVRYAAHELYGHIRPYILGQRYSHYQLGDSFDMMVGGYAQRALQNFLGGGK